MEGKMVLVALWAWVMGLMRCCGVVLMEQCMEAIAVCCDRNVRLSVYLMV